MSNPQSPASGGHKKHTPSYLTDFYKYDATSRILFRYIQHTPDGIILDELFEALNKVGINTSGRHRDNIKILIEQSGCVSWQQLKEFTIRFGPLLMCNDTIDEFIRDDAKKWYHGNYLVKESAKEILEAEYNKTPEEKKDIFVVRTHRNPSFFVFKKLPRVERLQFCHAFTISVYRYEDRAVNHHAVFRNSRGYMALDEKDGHPFFFLSFDYVLDYFKLLNSDRCRSVPSENFVGLIKTLAARKKSNQGDTPLYFPPEKTPTPKTEELTPSLSVETELREKHDLVPFGKNVEQYAKQHRFLKDDATNWYLLGKGGSSNVYLAEYKRQLVAVKVLAPHTFFADRINQIKQLSHQNLVQILEFIEVSQKRYLVMELMDSDLLRERLNHKNKISPDEFWKTKGKNIAIDILKGLEFLHSHQIIHKDIKSANIFIKHSGEKFITKIGDLDNIRKQSSNYMNQTSYLVSPAYASPEQLTMTNEPQNLTIYSDIYSFGVVLWEIVSLEVPWRYFTTNSISHQVVSGNFLKVHLELLSEDKNEIIEIISQCCQLIPENRPNSTKLIEMIDKLPPIIL